MDLQDLIQRSTNIFHFEQIAKKSHAFDFDSRSYERNTPQFSMEFAEQSCQMKIPKILTLKKKSAHLKYGYQMQGIF